MASNMPVVLLLAVLCPCCIHSSCASCRARQMRFLDLLARSLLWYRVLLRLPALKLHVVARILLKHLGILLLLCWRCVSLLLLRRTRTKAVVLCGPLGDR